MWSCLPRPWHRHTLQPLSTCLLRSLDPAYLPACCLPARPCLLPRPARLLQISSLAFSPDGTTLASADAGGALIAWDLTSAKRVASTSQHRGPVWSLAYSRGEGSLLASGGADHTVRIWNAKPAAGGAAGAQQGQQPAAAGAAAPAAAAAAAQQPAQGGQPGKHAAGDGSALGEPYAPLCTWRTKMTPVFGLRFTTQNLLLGSGALTLPQRPAAPRG